MSWAFIDLRGVSEAPARFAYYGTTSQEFLRINNCQAWAHFGHFIADMEVIGKISELDMIVAATPAWAYEAEDKTPAPEAVAVAAYRVARPTATEPDDEVVAFLKAKGVFDAS